MKHTIKFEGHKVYSSKWLKRKASSLEDLYYTLTDYDWILDGACMVYEFICEREKVNYLEYDEKAFELSSENYYLSMPECFEKVLKADGINCSMTDEEWYTLIRRELGDEYEYDMVYIDGEDDLEFDKNGRLKEILCVEYLGEITYFEKLSDIKEHYNLDCDDYYLDEVQSELRFVCGPVYPRIHRI